jgi:hypothetical protein
MNRGFVRKNIPLFSLILYIIVYSIIIFIKPYIIYNKNGSLRTFGIGYKSRTVLPVWLVSIIIAILSYFSVMYYVSYPELQF